ncbi:MAG: hypothetical protein ACJ8G2_02990 [Burkholderiales bacterium]
MKRSLWIMCLLPAALSWNTARAAEPLGRLFFTPAQRHIFDSGKQLPSTTPKAAPPGPQTAKLNGVVTRSDGENTVWINGHTIDRKNPPIKATASPTDPAVARVELPDAKNSVKLKVGQRYVRSTGKIIESYQQSRQGGDLPAQDSMRQDSLNQATPRSQDGGRAAGTLDQNGEHAPAN